MSESIVQYKRFPLVPVVSFAIIAICAAIVLTLALDSTPISTTLDVTVIALTDRGCVAETPFSDFIIVDDCTAEIGDVIPATFSISEHQKTSLILDDHSINNL